MYELYGTFLIHTIEKHIREEGPLTLREIVENIAPQLEERSREQSNLYHRVRRAVLFLVDHERASRSWEISSNNIPIQKFSANERITDDQADAADGIRARHDGTNGGAAAPDG